jgi:hypothetical protein
VTTFNNAVRNAPVGIFLQQALDSKLFLNLLRDTAKGIHALENATGNTYFLNRHVSSMPNYAEPTSAVTYHGGATFGGNFQLGGKVLTDAYPYGFETLGRAPSVAVLLPAASSVVSAGLRKTIEWRSTGCTHVDLYYKPSAGAQQLIVANYPDTGVYQWTVPALSTGTSYTIVIDCKTRLARRSAYQDPRPHPSRRRMPASNCSRRKAITASLRARRSRSPGSVLLALQAP